METRSADNASLIRPASTDSSWRQAAGKGEWVALRLTHSRELLMARRARATSLPLSHATTARFRALHRGRRELHLEPLKVIHHDARDNEIAEPIVVGGHHEPGRVVGTAAVACVFVGVLIIVPKGALAIICLADFPVPRRIAQPFLETFELLAGANVEKEFEVVHTVVAEITFEGIDAVVTRLPHLFRHQIVDTRH